MDNRAHYRIDLAGLEDAQVSVKTAQGVSVLGQILDLSIGGLGLRFSLDIPLPGCPDITVGEEVELSFASDRFKRPLAVSARVVHRLDEESSRRYGLQFSDRQQLEDELATELFRLFNRRKTYRVEPDPDVPIEVTLEHCQAGVQVQAQVKDISVGGLGVRVPADVKATLGTSDRVKVAISLPGHQDPVILIGNICHRREAGEEIHYGIEFDLEQSEDPKRQQNAITDYVMKRQRAALRRVKTF